MQVAPENPQLDQQLAKSEEAQGMPRLKEILTAHMWPGLILKDQSKTGAACPNPSAAGQCPELLGFTFVVLVLSKKNHFLAII